VLHKVAEKAKKVVEVDNSEVALPGRVEEPELHVVAELSNQVMRDKLSVAGRRLE